MKRLVVPTLLFQLAAIFLAGCTPYGNLPTPLPQSLTPTLLAPTASLTPTPSPTTLTPTATPTSTRPAPTLTASPGMVFPPEDILKYQPVQFLSSLPAEVRPDGALVLKGLDSFLLYFESRKLTVESADRQHKHTILLDFYLYDGHWVNNQQMAFNYE